MPASCRRSRSPTAWSATWRLLATGAFSPLDRFMGQADHQRVLDEMRLAERPPLPHPRHPAGRPRAPRSSSDQDIALRNAKNELLAVMTIEEIYAWDLDEVAQKVFGTIDLRHPLVAEMHRWGKLNISGRLQVLQPAQALRLPRPAPDPGPDPRPPGASSATPTWWPSRPATRCTACTRS